MHLEAPEPSRDPYAPIRGRIESELSRLRAELSSLDAQMSNLGDLRKRLVSDRDFLVRRLERMDDRGDGNGPLTGQGIGLYARSADIARRLERWIATYGRGAQSALVRSSGVSRRNIYAILHAERELVTIDLAEKLLRALGEERLLGDEVPVLDLDSREYASHGHLQIAPPEAPRSCEEA